MRDPIELFEVSLRLDSYDDIFSDFDIRSYSKRSLSIDFLDEIKRSINEKDGKGIELLLYAPEKERDSSKEVIIKGRLAAHFKKHYHLLKEEKRRVIKLGIGMVIAGIISMFAATFVLFKDPSRSLLLSFLVIFLEPAAWFLWWEGMDLIIFQSKKINPELYFYHKMFDSHERIHFKSY
jgi:hypothetical protein